jgi:drug/metabolite transporter (DMT)-like permease
VHTGLVYILLYSALPKLSTPLIAVLLYLYPASAVIFDVFVYQHALSFQTLFGLGLVILASIGVTLRLGDKSKAISPLKETA